MTRGDIRAQDTPQPLTYIPIITPVQAVRLLHPLGLRFPARTR